MNLIEKVKAMLGITPKATRGYGSPDVSRALQRNEIAQQNARRALESIKMSDTMRDIAGKMK